LIEPIIGAARAERLVDIIGQLEALRSTHELRPLLQA
jgi:hypothetical protein